MTKTIVFVQKLSDEHAGLVQSEAPEWTIVHGKDASSWLAQVPNAEIIVGWNAQVQSASFGQVPTKLRWVHSWGAGVDQFPLQELAARGIYLTNSSGVHAYPISETIFALMLSLTRKIDTYVRMQQQKRWYHAGLNLEMHGKSVCILGVGAIGGETARLAKAFYMTTSGVRRTGEPHPDIDHMYSMEALHDALGQADYVVNTLPLTAETHHIINEKAFERMKPTAYYINIGRGGTTDTVAMVNALQEGKIAGAGLDVFETEPLPPDHGLWAMENVIITPHSSGSTGAYEARALDIFLQNLRRYQSGDEPSINRVDLLAQY